jgi:hypothetical protein
MCLVRQIIVFKQAGEALCGAKRTGFTRWRERKVAGSMAERGAALPGASVQVEARLCVSAVPTVVWRVVWRVYQLAAALLSYHSDSDFEEHSDHENSFYWMFTENTKCSMQVRSGAWEENRESQHAHYYFGAYFIKSVTVAHHTRCLTQ